MGTSSGGQAEKSEREQITDRISEARGREMQAQAALKDAGHQIAKAAWDGAMATAELGRFDRIAEAQRAQNVATAPAEDAPQAA